MDGDARADAVDVDRYEGGCPDRIRTFLVRSGGPVRHVQPASSLWSPVLSDLDGDGRTDLVLSGIPGLSALFFRNVCGNPHERAAPSPPFPVRPRGRP